MKKNLNFGNAIQELKEGNAVKRSTWNGMTVYLNKGSRDISQPASEKNPEGVPFYLFNSGDKETITRMPNLNMQITTGATVTGWNPTQVDMLAEDWEVVETNHSVVFIEMPNFNDKQQLPNVTYDPNTK